MTASDVGTVTAPSGTSSSCSSEDLRTYSGLRRNQTEDVREVFATVYISPAAYKHLGCFWTKRQPPLLPTKLLTNTSDFKHKTRPI